MRLNATRCGVLARSLLLVLVACLLPLGCTGRSSGLRVGFKDFAEQEILAHVVRLTLLDHDLPASVVSCGDTFGCQQALRRGDIDIYVEYSGTAALYAGHPEAHSLEALQKVYEPWGLSWISALGFDNGYRVVTLQNRAITANIDSIDDLRAISGGRIRVACPGTYLRRSGDGLSALLERHGLSLAGTPVVASALEERLDALRTGRADVAILYATDGELLSRDLRALDDTLHFFPRYDAALLTRSDLVTDAKVSAALLSLRGQFDTESMRKLNLAAQQRGFAPQQVAQRALHERGLLEQRLESSSLPVLRLAVAQSDRLTVQTERAAKAVRETFTGRAVAVDRLVDPIAAVASGKARMAILGAERFFSGSLPQLDREARIEAVAVIGSRMLHLLRRRDDPAQSLAGRIGIEATDSGSGRMAATVLERTGSAATEEAPLPRLLEHLRDGSLDAVLVSAEVGDPDLATALTVFAELRPLPERALQGSAPYVRHSRIPSHSYDGQTRLIETLSTQVLLAGPSHSIDAVPFKGPAAALPQAAVPLGLQDANSLSTALGVLEGPDPLLPSIWTATSPHSSTTHPPLVNTIVSIATLSFLLFLAYLLGRPGLGPSQMTSEKES